MSTKLTGNLQHGDRIVEKDRVITVNGISRRGWGRYTEIQISYRSSNGGVGTKTYDHDDITVAVMP